MVKWNFEKNIRKANKGAKVKEFDEVAKGKMHIHGHMTCVAPAISKRTNAVFQVAPMELNITVWNCFYKLNAPKELFLLVSLAESTN